MLKKIKKVLLLILIIPGIASAIGEFLTYEILIDSDNNPSSGCSYKGQVGVDLITEILIDIQTTSPFITQVATKNCIGSNFGDLTITSNGDWPISSSNNDGSNSIEGSIPLNVLGASSTVNILGINATTVNENFNPSNGLITISGRVPIISSTTVKSIPSTSDTVLTMMFIIIMFIGITGIKRKKNGTSLITIITAPFLFFTLMTLSEKGHTETITVDGVIADWPLSTQSSCNSTNGLGQLLSGPGSVAGVISNCYFTNDSDNFYFRLDANLFGYIKDEDEDEASNGLEEIVGTNPNNPDTDKDLLLDGYEIQSGLDPLTANDSSLDTDGDGLSDLDEQIIGTDPRKADTDGDGTNDFDEQSQCSDPNDPTDKDSPPNSSDIVKLELTVGDQSGSHSERYHLIVGGIRHQAPEFGVLATKEYCFKKGIKYQIRIVHTGSNRSIPDYDYTAKINGVGNGGIFILDDPEGIMGIHGESNIFFADGKNANLYIPDIGFVDNRPNYSKELAPNGPLLTSLDSDNYFFRENNDHKDIDIYYKINLDKEFSIESLKIKTMSVIGSGNNFQNMIEINEINIDVNKVISGINKETWDANINNTSSDLDEGVYVHKLVMTLKNSKSELHTIETNINDADGSENGWQPPNDSVPVYDLVRKHRPVLHVTATEEGLPTTTDIFEVASCSRPKYYANFIEVPNDFGTCLRTDPSSSEKFLNIDINKSLKNGFWDLFNDNVRTIGDFDDLSTIQKDILTTDSSRTAIHHSVHFEHKDILFIQYWLFYDFSRAPFILVVGQFDPDISHEGDLEHVQIAIKYGDKNKKASWLQPFAATASQHFYAQTLPWSNDTGKSNSANAVHSQKFVEHQGNRLVIYSAYGSHATYFAEDNQIAVPITDKYLGTETMYDIVGLVAKDVTKKAIKKEYRLLSINNSSLGKYTGSWGMKVRSQECDNALSKFICLSHQGVPGITSRSAFLNENSFISGNGVVLKNSPVTLHNKAIRSDDLKLPGLLIK